MADALQQVNWFIDGTDDPLIGESLPAFDGGQFSNIRANLLQPNQSASLLNCDVDKLGKLRTRRGTLLIANAAATNPEPSGVAGTNIQGLTSYQTADANYIVAANNGKLWAWNEIAQTWTQIALGGVADHEDVFIARVGQINQPGTAGPPVIPPGYPAGTTSLVVWGLPTSVPLVNLLAAGEKLYFTNNLRTDYYEYTIASWTPSGGGVLGNGTITLEEPGLVFDVDHNWAFTVLRPAKVTNPTPGNRYPAGASSIAISGYTGTPAIAELFVIKSDNVTRILTAGSTNVLLNFTTVLQSDWAAHSVTAPVMFAQGNDALYFTDGTGAIYGWKGSVPTGGVTTNGGGTISAGTIGGGTLMQIGSHSILDDFAGNYVQTRTTPPQNVGSIIWFQNRLIAASIASEPDAIYFSDVFNAGAWDADYQKVRIGGGESDPITGLLAWSDLNMIVFKKNSCYLMNLDPNQNPDPTDSTLLVASFAVKQLHKLIGCPAPRTAVQVGGGSTTPGSDIFFMDGDKKVRSLRRVMAAETQQEIGSSVSLPIQDVLDRTNLTHIDKCVAMYHNEHYILGFPSTRGADGGLECNSSVAYNMLTTSWCGVWDWFPVCFSRRTDIGFYSKMILGDWRSTTGRVLQWYDDQSLDDETDATYQDFGLPIVTTIVTRALTFGNLYTYKTGLNVEFEFDESVANPLTVTVLLDKVSQDDLIADPFSTLSTDRPIRLPRVLPFTLSSSPDLLRKGFDLQRYGTWRELQFVLNTAGGKLAIRSVRVTGWYDTIRLQTLPDTGIPAFGLPPTTGP